MKTQVSTSCVPRSISETYRLRRSLLNFFLTVNVRGKDMERKKMVWKETLAAP